jgi:hypothetical protein
VGASAEMLEKIPIAGQIYGAYLRTAGAIVESFTGVVEGFVQRGEVLSRYSGAVAGARAGADVRSTLGDIREAQLLGADTGRLTTGWSEIQDLIREILLPLKGAVLKRLADVVETGADFLEKIAPLLEIGMEAHVKLFDLACGLQLDVLLEWVSRMATTLEKIFGRMPKQDKPIDNHLLMEFYSAMDPGQLPGLGRAAADPQRADMQQRLNAPVFAGV